MQSSKYSHEIMVASKANSISESSDPLNKIYKELKLSEVNRKLFEKRREFQRIIGVTQQRRGRLEVRKADLMEQMQKFEGFVRDNEAKRRRAIQKFNNEVFLCKQRSSEEKKLERQLTKVKQEYQMLSAKVEQYKKYETYLMRVISILPADYIKIADNILAGLIMRYNTLYDTNTILLKEMSEKSEQIREAQSQLASLRDEHGNRILTLNAELAALYEEREETNESYQCFEQSVENQHRELRTELSMFGRIIRSVDNLVGKCGWPYTSALTEVNLHSKLLKIRDYIITTTEILSAISTMNGRSIHTASSSPHNPKPALPPDQLTDRNDRSTILAEKLL